MSTQGDGMAEVTEADREKAWWVLCALPISIPGYSPETVRKAQDHLAAALAEEREKARVPFLALAELWEGYAAEQIAQGLELSPPATALLGAAMDIRRAAEEG